MSLTFVEQCYYEWKQIQHISRWWVRGCFFSFCQRTNTEFVGKKNSQMTVMHGTGGVLVWRCRIALGIEACFSLMELLINLNVILGEKGDSRNQQHPVNIFFVEDSSCYEIHPFNKNVCMHYRAGEFSKILNSQGFILPASRMECTVEYCYDKIYTTTKIIHY